MNIQKLDAVLTVLSDPKLGDWFKGRGITPSLFKADNVDAYARSIFEFNYGRAADRVIEEGEDAGLLPARWLH